MRRKLINYDVFERIENDSLSSASKELVEAENVLATTLDVDNMELKCYGPETVVYEASDGSYVHASWSMRENHILFENIEQLVIDEESEQHKSRSVVTDMVDAILEGQDKKASQLFSDYVELPGNRRSFGLSEAKEFRVVDRGDGPKRVRWEADNFKSQENSGDTINRMKKKKMAKKKRGKGKEAQRARKRSAINKQIGKGTKGVMAKKKMNEFAHLCENVIGYIDYQHYGPALRESTAKYDDKGNVVAIKVPNLRLRNEAALKNLNYDVLSTESISKRNDAKKSLAEDQGFWRAMAELKRHNNLSDNEALEECLENIVSSYVNVLYLTESELSSVIANSLDSVGATNYDDQICSFMAEGVLRTAHRAYAEKVNKIMRLAGTPVAEGEEDAYESFKTAVETYYPHLDENAAVEMQVYADLYEALRIIHDVAEDEKNHGLQAETVAHLNNLLPILTQETEPTVEVAEAASDFLWDIVETNLGGSDWSVSNSTHVTVSGDHPAMAQKAGHSYTPSRDAHGDMGDGAPVSDGKSYRGGLADEMRNRSWGNESGGGETYPSLNNPYILKPFGDYKMKGEKHIDVDSDKLAHWSSGDTWPDMQNPYVPKAETPSSYKMNQGKEADLVVDK